MDNFRQAFEFFSQVKRRQHAPTASNAIEENNTCIYLDSAATTQKLRSVTDAVNRFSNLENASVHRGAYPLANRATTAYESARSALASYLGANASDEIVLTSGATESINMIANGIDRTMLTGRYILLCESEHHANILPWQALAKRFDLGIKVLKLANNAECNSTTLESWLRVIDEDCAILACAHVSNVLGNIYPVQALCNKARQCGALSVIDGTQALAHLEVNVQNIACDFYAFSAHKAYGPTGTGGFYGRLDLLEQLKPSKLGGEMVEQVSFQHFSTQAPPLKFEAGTPNVHGVIGFAAAIAFLQEHIRAIQSHELSLYTYLMQRLTSIASISCLGNNKDSIGIVSFIVKDADNHSIVSQLYAQGVALRFGQHCAQPLLESLGIKGCMRVSLGCYNTMEDVDIFIDALKQAIEQDGRSDQLNTQNPKRHSANGDQNVSRESAQEQEDIAAWERQLLAAKDWSAKHRLLLLISKELPSLNPAQRTNQHAISGCEAHVWMAREAEKKGQLLAHSDSKVVRGLLALLLLKHQALNKQAVSSTVNYDFSAYLSDLGLSAYFSEGRKDGIRQVIKAIERLSSA